MALALSATSADAASSRAARPRSAADTAQPLIQIGPITDISRGLAGDNAEVEAAAPRRSRYVYDEWIAARGIGFARSTDSGRSFDSPVLLPRSSGGWDPSVAVGPGGVVYAAFMSATATHPGFPIVEVSHDHGQQFTRIRDLIPAKYGNWGDRDFITVGPHGTAYLTWDYGPSAAKVTFYCPSSGSCAFTAGDFNEVIQKSTTGGRTWTRLRPVSPGFPVSGADNGPLLVQPNGRVDVLYQSYPVVNPSTLRLGALGHEHFTASSDGGREWSKPVRLGPKRPGESDFQWWIDGDLAVDAAGNLYATWDTQQPATTSPSSDIGRLSVSVNHGRTWTRPIRVTPDNDGAMHLVQVTGGSRGLAYVAWLSDQSPQGYALYLRVYSVGHGWLTKPLMVSSQFGEKTVWPGDTIGVAVLRATSSTTRIALSWGSQVGTGTDHHTEIYSTVATITG